MKTAHCLDTIKILFNTTLNTQFHSLNHIWMYCSRAPMARLYWLVFLLYSLFVAFRMTVCISMKIENYRTIFTYMQTTHPYYSLQYGKQMIAWFTHTHTSIHTRVRYMHKGTTDIKDGWLLFHIESKRHRGNTGFQIYTLTLYWIHVRPTRQIF